LSIPSATRNEDLSAAALAEAAHRAARQGKLGQAADLLAAAVERHEGRSEPLPRSAYQTLAFWLCEANRLPEAEAAARRAQQKQRKNAETANLLGVILRRQGRLDEALRHLEESARLDRGAVAPLINRGNVLLDLRRGAEAAEAFARAARIEPRNGELRRRHGQALHQAGRFAEAEQAFRMATRLAPDDPWSWIALANVLEQTQRIAEAQATLGTALGRLGAVRELGEAQVASWRRRGLHAEALRWLEELARQRPNEAWIYLQAGHTVVGADRPRANRLYAKALELAPGDPDILVYLADSLDRTRGPDEAQNISAGYRLALRRIGLGGNLIAHAHTLRSILIRSADYDAAAGLGSFAELGSHFAGSDNVAALHHLMTAVATVEDRRNLVSWHRAWGRSVDALAAKSPLERPPAVAGRARIRLGFMSSDLRHHPVGYYVASVLDNYDRSRFEVYCYSWNELAPDAVQERIAGQVDAFRLRPRVGDRDAALLIAADRLDMLIELGGSTDMNKLKVMAWRPAPRQASWLGYPHSSGLETIDRIVTDPWLTPAAAGLLIERPLELAHSWVAFDQPGFGTIPAIEPEAPQARNGLVTFGTMNNPWKYTPALLATWAEVLRAVPGSRLLFVRPEGGVPEFRENLARRFASLGVAPARLAYVAVRGAHLAHYNQIDVSLDTFPHTGGTTTCETLWMGVPVVTLVGESFCERMSYSNLANAGLPELCTRTRADYVAKAVAVAGDLAWRQELRRTLRERIRSHPLGRPDRFARDFEAAMLRWMDEPPR
jgi:predicted O-linked N-acetylglucosamine transferase (SPINDLY family)